MCVYICMRFTFYVLLQMKVMKGLTMRIPLSGPDPFYYVTDRV